MFGLMRKKTHMKIYTKQGQAYRREIEEAKSAKRVAEEKLRDFVKTQVECVARTNSFPDGNPIFTVELSRHAINLMDHHVDIIPLVHREIMNRLYTVPSLNRDSRGDLRQTQEERDRARYSLKLV